MKVQKARLTLSEHHRGTPILILPRPGSAEAPYSLTNSSTRRNLPCVFNFLGPQRDLFYLFWPWPYVWPWPQPSLHQRGQTRAGQQPSPSGSRRSAVSRELASRRIFGWTRHTRSASTCETPFISHRTRVGFSYRRMD